MTESGLELLPRDGRAVLVERAFAPGLFEPLRQELDWQEEQIRLFGRVHTVPRLVAYYGEAGYTYAGAWHPPRPLPERLQTLKAQTEAIAGCAFNSVLCNFYRHGQDGMGYHRDDEPEIDTRCIASLSLGATRRFKLRHRETREVVTVDLEDGALLLMLDCQTHWEHALVKTKKPVGGRINLTFRWIDPATSRRRAPTRPRRGLSG